MANISFYPIAFWLGLFLSVFFIAKYIMSRCIVVPGNMAFVVENLGKPVVKPLRSGFHFLHPFLRIRAKVNLSQIQLEGNSQVKTSDDTFVTIAWVLRYKVDPSDQGIINYVYVVKDPQKRLMFKVENELRQSVANQKFDDLYSQRDVLSKKIESDQKEDAESLGILIVDVVMEQPTPPGEIQNAMNRRRRADAELLASEAEAKTSVTRARGEAEGQKLAKQINGEGIALERDAIYAGLAESFKKVKDEAPGISETDIIRLLIATTEAEMVTAAARSDNTTIVFVTREASDATRVLEAAPIKV